ncbi:resolvase [Anaerocolumna cellulosilytica]|uniref:Resolvase n=1 Tax=Anaerocolumna cellulosilytica TaxID=433286 RepID=A0A6S6R0L0_9FIRM|nr:recombinase family protein [Anaerocolumna cellulosilytica]MBB5196088.1 DNA invertase Pin-like site-specific DNA recombinase [Anaerocolumna cellulosilytica]BCJ93607.1 resolvase [Anaerocolumna cellulosilytica]
MEFRVGGYLRLSNEDGDNKQSESIENQLSIIQQYLDNHQELVLVDTYIDDGYTGMNYDRDEFKRMMCDIEAGKINTIVTKDLSRLGRDQVETSRLIKKDFIIRKIRYIAIDDNIDTFNEERNDIVVPFRILFNDFYSQDISVKIKAALNSKRKRGDFIGAFAPFGYQKDSNNNNRLIPDEEAAAIVRRIFQMYLQGYGKMKIARILNKEGILCPTEYKREKKEKYQNSRKLSSTNYWTYSTINRILSNEVYIGHMVQHKQEKISYNLKQHRAVPAEKYIVVNNTHEAIIEAETFDIVQKLLKSKNRNPGLEQNITMYAGLLKCGDCGRRLAKTKIKTKTGDTIYYKCGSYKQYGKEVCSSHSIREDVLNDIVLDTIKEEAQEALTQKDIDIMKTISYNEPRDNDELKLSEIKMAMVNLKQEKSNMLRMLAKGVINESDYQNFQTEIDQEERKYQEKETILRDKQSKTNKYLEQHDKWILNFINYVNIDSITREILVSLIDEINVFEDKRIIISFKFKSPFL